jgi:GMP synthase (glutamine-hydrolysing)
MMCRWTIRGQARFALPGARPRAEHFADRPVYDYAIRSWLAGFLDHWLGLAHGAASTGKSETRGPALAARQLSAAE